MNKNLRNTFDPVVWVAIITLTLALLPVFQKTLWLVVPALLALLLYYALYPLVQILVFRGIARIHTAGVVMVAFMILLGGAGALLVPQAASHALDWQAVAERHLEGGLRLLNQGLTTLEAHFPSLARAHLAETAAQRLDQSVGIIPYIEPIVLGIVRVVCETAGVVVTDPRIRARHRHARWLRRNAATEDLVMTPGAAPPPGTAGRSLSAQPAPGENVGRPALP